MKESSKVGRDALWLTISKVLAGALTMVSAMLLARVRTLEENGIYAQLLLVINMATSIFMLGLPNSINYFLAKADTKKEKSHFLSVYYSSSTLLSIVLGGALTLLMPLWISYFNNPRLGEFPFFLMIFPWSKVIGSSVENILIVYRKVKLLLVYRFLNSALLLFIIFFVWVTGKNFFSYMVLYVIVESCFAVLVYVIAAYFSGGIRLSFDFKLLKTILAFSIPIGLAGIVGTLNIEIDKLMIGRFFSVEQLAIYTNASKEMPVTLVASSITAVLMPQMVSMFHKNETRNAIELWKTATSLSFAIIAFFSIGLAFFSKEALVFLYSEKYRSGWPIFLIYSLTLLVKCTYFGIVLNTTGNTKFVLYSSIGTLILNVAFNFIFYNLFGMIGPAIATLLSSFAMNILQLYFSAQIVGVKFSKIFPWGECGKIVSINIGMGCGFLSVHQFVCEGVFGAIILAAFWGITYFVCIRKKLMEYWRQLNR